MNQREQFEQFAEKNGYDTRKTDNGYFSDIAVDIAWEAWRAAQAAIEIGGVDMLASVLGSDHDRQMDYDLVQITSRYINEREQIIALCNRYAQPGVNTQTHEVCYRILQILGEREVSK